jgi:small-conductance mechanosensitive channel
MRKHLKQRADHHLERMFETRSDAWEQVGLAIQSSQRAIRKARRQAIVFGLLLAVLLTVFGLATQHVILPDSVERHWDTPIRIATALALIALGWAVARDVGRAAAPTFFRRMDPGTAGTVGFVIRLVAIAITLLAALTIAGLNGNTLLAGSAITAIVVGLAAQQTLGNLFAGLVIVSARPFRVGERVRLQAGAVAGQIEGVVSSQGLLYTTLARGEDRIMIPNTVVLSAAVLPLREPDPVDVRVRLSADIRPSQVQAILDDTVRTPTRREARVVLQEIDGDEAVVRVQATPESPTDVARLADEIIAALATVTGEHQLPTPARTNSTAED